MTEQALNGKPVADFGPDHPFTGAPIVSQYTRSQALEDGVLIDVTEQAKGKRFRYPVAFTAALWSQVVAAGVDPEKEGESGTVYTDRIGHVLDGLRAAIRDSRGGTDEVAFQITAPPQGDAPPLTFPVWARCHGGDDHAPCITVMTQGED